MPKAVYLEQSYSLRLCPKYRLYLSGDPELVMLRPIHTMTEANLWEEVLGRLPPACRALLRQHGRLTSLLPELVEIQIRSEPLSKIAFNYFWDIQEAFSFELGAEIQLKLSSAKWELLPPKTTVLAVR